jgi:DMSO/TMAO reductase YedYZ molybdopterin-dependent catalytic subunit
MTRHRPPSRRGFLQHLTLSQPEHTTTHTPSINPLPTFFVRPVERITSVDSAGWMLTIDHENHHRAAFTLSDLTQLPSLECTYTIACESSNPRDLLLGTALWKGVSLAQLMDDLSIASQARSLQITAVDGQSRLLPLNQLHNAILAYQMNNEPLLAAHGAPLRLIVPGAVGSAMPKWIRSLRFTDQIVAQPIPMAPTAAHILTPHHRQRVTGLQQFTGIAYAGDRVLHAVEISIDGADWSSVSFTGTGQFSWATWTLDWNPPTPGDYHIRVRAHDTLGLEQGFIPSASHDVILRVSEALSS